MKNCILAVAAVAAALCISAPASAAGIQTFNVNGTFEYSGGIFSGASFSPGSTITIDTSNGVYISANILLAGDVFNVTDFAGQQSGESGYFELALHTTSSTYPLLVLALAESGSSLVGYNGGIICAENGDPCGVGSGIWLTPDSDLFLEMGSVTPTCQATAPGAPQPPEFIGTVYAFPGGPLSADNKPTFEYATFVPTGGLTSAKMACGFSDFDWQQTVTASPTPSNASTADDPTTPLTAPWPDPPPWGYYAQTLDSDLNYTPNGAYPFFYWIAGQTGPTILSLISNEGDDTSLEFSDCPKYKGLPPGSDMEFTTSLVGVYPNAVPSAPLYTLKWKSTYDGTRGGVSSYLYNDPFPGDPGSGTGGVTITSINGVSVVPTPSSGTACNGLYNGTFKGSITVSTGQTCTFVGGGVNGQIALTGGTLVLSGATVSQNVQVNGGSFFIGPSATINGNLQIQNIPAGTAQSQVCGTNVTGNLQFQNNGTPVQIGSASTGACPGNTIGHNLLIDSNTASTQVFNNIVTNNLQCQNNTSISGGGNTAKHKDGQCASF